MRCGVSPGSGRADTLPARRVSVAMTWDVMAEVLDGRSGMALHLCDLPSAKFSKNTTF